MISNSNFIDNKSKSQGSTPMLPVLDNNRRNLKSSSPSQIKRKNSQNQKKSIFFPKIIQNEINLNLFSDNEFILDEKTAFFPNKNANKSKNIFGKYEGKIFQKFPKDFFPNFQK